MSNQSVAGVSCDYCGADATVNHVATKIDTTIDMIIRSVRVGSIFVYVDYVIEKLWPLFFRLCVLLHVISLREEIAASTSDRSQAIWDEAQRRGLRIRQLHIFGHPTELFEVRHNKRWSVFESLPINKKTVAISTYPDDKQNLNQTLQKAHIPIPVSYSITQLSDAEKILADLRVVCIKPRVGSNGRHTFPHVSNMQELSYAFRSAQQLCHWVIVQEHIEGDLGRAICVGGRLVAFHHSERPTVVGDGRSTIRELVEYANKTKQQRVAAMELNPVHQEHISRYGYQLDDVLESEVQLPLTYSAGRLSGGDAHEYGDDIHPVLKEELEKAARVLGMPVVGFDLILQDPAKHPQDQRWAIIEANSLPYIELHQDPEAGKVVNVAKYIWDAWE